MTYRNDLKWLADLRSFPREQQKILLALSNDKYLWRSKDRLQAVTDLEPLVLDNALAQLIKQQLVAPSLSDKENMIFGLRERVDPQH